MQAFVQVVEHESFSAAATALGLTPSAVSKLVSRLESRLGVRLLHRSTRRLSLTSEGNTYFVRARQILSDIEDVEAEVVRSRASPRGRLHVNTNNAPRWSIVLAISLLEEVPERQTHHDKKCKKTAG